MTRKLPALLAAILVPILAATILGCTHSSDRLDAFKTGQAKTKATAELRRGMNFGDAMDAPEEGAWGWRISASDFKVVRDAGFDHVRVPMRISAHAGREPPY